MKCEQFSSVTLTGVSSGLSFRTSSRLVTEGVSNIGTKNTTTTVLVLVKYGTIISINYGL